MDGRAGLRLFFWSSLSDENKVCCIWHSARRVHCVHILSRIRSFFFGRCPIHNGIYLLACRSKTNETNFFFRANCEKTPSNTQQRIKQIPFFSELFDGVSAYYSILAHMSFGFLRMFPHSSAVHARAHVRIVVSKQAIVLIAIGYLLLLVLKLKIYTKISDVRRARELKRNANNFSHEQIVSFVRARSFRYLHGPRRHISNVIWLVWSV